MSEYQQLLVPVVNDREKIMRNTYDLNELMHTYGIDEAIDNVTKLGMKGRRCIRIRRFWRNPIRLRRPRTWQIVGWSLAEDGCAGYGGIGFRQEHVVQRVHARDMEDLAFFDSGVARASKDCKRMADGCQSRGRR